MLISFRSSAFARSEAGSTDDSRQALRTQFLDEFANGIGLHESPNETGMKGPLD